MQLINKNIEDLIQYANNARTHSDEQVLQIASSIKEFGFTNPVLLDEKDGVIAGHGRIMAAKLLKMDEVPTITLSGLTEAQIKAYIIADNKLALNSGWDEEMLKVELSELEELGYDMDLTGFEKFEIDELFGDEENITSEEFGDKNKEVDVDNYDDEMILKFKLTFSEYEEANTKLREIANSPENALKILLKMEI
jgi:ParB family transcriptional regulator, chromosome partitioning protein